MKLNSVFSLAAVALLSTVMMASAQNGGGGGNGGGRGNRGNRGNRANVGASGAQQGAQGANMMQRRTDRIKTELKATDEEWVVLQPLVEKVTTAQREARGNGGRGGRGGGQQGGQGGPAGGGQGGGSPEAQALRAALDNESTPAADLQAKMAALRNQHKKAAATLAQAREDLKKVLTARQEAVLLADGLLE